MSVWTHEASAFDAVGTCPYIPSISSYTGIVGEGAWSPSLGLFCVVGQNCDASVAVITSPGDGVWTSRGNPWGQAKFGAGLGIDWSPTLNLFVAAGFNDDNSINVVTSPDGINWTPRASGCSFGDTVRWLPDAAKFWMICAVGGNVPYTSPDGINWTAGTSPTNLRLIDVAHHAGVGWVGIGSPTIGANAVATSPDGLNWTTRSSPMTGDVGLKVIWSDTLGLFVAVGRPVLGVAAMTSPDGISWTAKTGPWDDLATGLVDIGGYLAIAGHAITPDRMIYYTPDLLTYTTQSTPLDDAAQSPSLIFAPTTNHLLAVGRSDPPGVAIIGTSPVAPRPFHRSRFFEGYPWRFIVADIPAFDPISPGGVTTTWAHGLLTNRVITKTLNQPTTIGAAVWPDDRRVNDIFTDGAPLIAQNNRIIYAFRREGGNPPWKIRAAAILMSPEDQGDADIPLSHLVAYDPWQYLMGRLCTDASGNPPQTAYGLSFTGTRGDVIAGTLLKNTILNHGFAFIDAGVAYGGTPFYSTTTDATIEATDTLVFGVQQGAMVGEAWRQLCDTGTLDITLIPIYDPGNRPGYTHELDIRKLAGADKPSVVFGWDKMNRALSTADRMHSGTPGDFVNKVLYFAGQGAPAAPVQTNTASVNAFGEIWSTQFFPWATIPSGQTPTLLAKQALRLGKQGKRTFTVNPTPERAPIPLRDYDVGDRVGIYTTKRLRVATTATFATTPAQAQRVEIIPIVVTDDGIEQIQALVTSPDWRDPT